MRCMLEQDCLSWRCWSKSWTLEQEFHIFKTFWKYAVPGKPDWNGNCNFILLNLKCCYGSSPSPAVPSQSKARLSQSSIDHIQSPSVITFNLSPTSSKGVALTCISVFSPLFEAQSPDLCVCPAFSALTLSLAFHWPLLKSSTLSPLTLIWSSCELHQYERTLICFLSKPGLPSALFWPLFKNSSNMC